MADAGKGDVLVIVVPAPGRGNSLVGGRRRIPGNFALLAANSSVHSSLLSAARVADALGYERECKAWRESALRVANAVAGRPEAFAPKDRWAMDWYYPVLAGRSAVTPDVVACERAGQNS